MQPSGWLRVHASAPIISHRCSISANVALLYCKAAVGLHIIKKSFILSMVVIEWLCFINVSRLLHKKNTDSTKLQPEYRRFFTRAHAQLPREAAIGCLNYVVLIGRERLNNASSDWSSLFQEVDRTMGAPLTASIEWYAKTETSWGRKRKVLLRCRKKKKRKKKKSTGSDS